MGRNNRGEGEEDYQKGARIVCHVGMVQRILVIGVVVNIPRAI